eukprot:6195041-Pleurochrysis_carterae.AAC.3
MYGLWKTPGASLALTTVGPPTKDMPMRSQYEKAPLEDARPSLGRRIVHEVGAKAPVQNDPLRAGVQVWLHAGRRRRGIAQRGRLCRDRLRLCCPRLCCLGLAQLAQVETSLVGVDHRPAAAEAADALPAAEVDRRRVDRHVAVAAALDHRVRAREVARALEPLARALVYLHELPTLVLPQKGDDLVVRAKRHVDVRQIDEEVEVKHAIYDRLDCVQHGHDHGPCAPLDEPTGRQGADVRMLCCQGYQLVVCSSVGLQVNVDEEKMRWVI